MTNPYVGPRTFGYEQRHLFFGREREARDLLARVLSERLLLFYAQSGAGKSSLLHTRLIPQLQEERGFVVLPVGRVGGELPDGVERVDNIYAFGLMLSIDAGDDPVRLAHVTLSDFLARLTRRTIIDSEGQEHRGWVYDANLASAPASPGTQRYALIVDQFEEIITVHPDRWAEREAFFRQLDEAVQGDPNLWVVLTLREEYVAALDPYAELTLNRLRARFYMERMGQAAALDAIRKPAELGGRPFAPDVAERLVDDLLQVRMPGQEKTAAGQHVEPVQLQVVCYQLWEKLQVPSPDARAAGEGEAGSTITMDDLRQAGDVNQALEQFYQQALADVLDEVEVEAAGMTERALRTWFGEELITETGIRSTVLRNQASGFTESMPNIVVDRLVDHRLLRIELRAGGMWVELVHDRLVGPIRDDNQTWFREHEDPLTRAAQTWLDADSDSALLYSGALLKAAQEQLDARPSDYGALENRFLTTSQDAERSRRTRRNRLVVAFAVAIALIIVFGILASWAVVNGIEARAAAYTAEAARGVAAGSLATAEAAQKVAVDLLAANEAKLYTLQTAQARPTEPDSTSTPPTPTSEPQGTLSFTPTPSPDWTATALAEELQDIQATRTRVAAPTPTPTPTPRLGDTRVREQDGAVLVYVPAGEFWMGSSDEDIDAVMAECSDCKREWYTNEQPQHKVYVDAFWIDRTEVTNAQYKKCVDAGACSPPVKSGSYTHSEYYGNPEFDDYPVVNVTWYQAKVYAEWVGGRLPTEAEWEYAARGPDSSIYPWGNEPPDSSMLNYDRNVDDTTAVGSYPDGVSWCGALDMAGNVWEWAVDWYGSDYYAQSPDRNPPGPDSGSGRVLRGGSWLYLAGGARAAVRYYRYYPDYSYDAIGFRCVHSLP